MRFVQKRIPLPTSDCCRIRRNHALSLTRLGVMTFMIAAVSACSSGDNNPSGGGAGSVCDHIWQAVCDKETTCPAMDRKVFYPDTATCVDQYRRSYGPSCEQTVTANPSSQQCADKATAMLSQMSCDEWIVGIIVPGITTCGTYGQDCSNRCCAPLACVNGACARPASLGLGDSCSASSSPGCGHLLTCGASGQCESVGAGLAGEGQACNDQPRPSTDGSGAAVVNCLGLLKCTNGTCALPSTDASSYLSSC